MTIPPPVLPPVDQRYFEDYREGAQYRYGPITVRADEIIEFAKRFDPQAMHVDPVFAAHGPFKGLIASGWHTTALVMRPFVDQFLTHIASLASPGVDELRWKRPVRPGDALVVHVTILETKRSQSKPDRGMVRCLIEAINQDGDVALSMKTMSLIGVRPVSRPGD